MLNTPAQVSRLLVIWETAKRTSALFEHIDGACDLVGQVVVLSSSVHVISLGRIILWKCR